MHGERERRGVEAVVHKAVGYVAAVDAVVVLEVRQIEYHFVCHTSRLARIICTELVGEGRRHVIGVDDSHFGGVAQTLLTQHLDVAVCDGQQHGRAPRCGRYGRDAVIAARGDNGVRGKEGLPGRNGTRCSATQMGPTPGPPPP